MKVQVTGRSHTHVFDAEPGEKILDAGLRSGLALPYECGSGTCGTCRARLVSGEIEDAWPDAPGRRTLKAEKSEFLMCQCEARADLSLEVATRFGPAPDDACLPEHLTAVVSAYAPLTHDVVQLDLDLERPIRFEAGQFVLLGVEGIAGRRAYSMVNYDRPADRLRLVVKKKPGGAVSEWLFAGGVVGARLDVFGPMGAATFTPDVDRHLLCLAGGSGIAGLMSILARACAERHFDGHRGTVIFGVRTPADIFFAQELAAFRAPCADALEIVLALSDAAVPADLPARHPGLVFDTGFVHDVAQRRMAGKYAGVRAYVAGPPPMVDASLRLLLKEARLSPADIRYDKFS
jgi:toluene monooxygenase electron transfer component